jgi:hypothetical protein
MPNKWVVEVSVPVSNPLWTHLVSPAYWTKRRT